MITLEKYFMGRDKTYEKELTEELIGHAKETVYRASTLIQEYMNATGNSEPSVRSGWRPLSVNAKIPNASKNFKHITCQAVDLADNSGKLRKWVMANLDKCEEIGLWVEHPDHTPSWLHIQTCPPKSESRVFVP
jgi:hypothetical protein